LESLIVMKQACWYENIYVVQKPVKIGNKKGGYNVKLYIDYKGKSRVNGKEEYVQNSIELENKIEEVYKYAYNRFILGN